MDNFDVLNTLTKKELYSIIILHGLVASDLTKPGGPGVPMEQYARMAVSTADILISKLNNK